jgi:hypothetical protein
MTPPNNTTDQPSIELLSLSILANLSNAHLCWIIFGFLCILTNLLVLITIIRTKDLHNKSQWIVFSLSLGELLYGVGMFATGTRRYAYYFFSKPDTIVTLHCMLIQFCCEIPGNAAFFFITALGIDRFLAVALPIFYHKINERRYIICVNAICWAFSIVWIPMAFRNNDVNAIVPVCLAIMVYTEEYLNMWARIGEASLILMVIIYTSTAAIIGFRYWKTKWNSATQKSEWMKEMQIRTFRTVIAIGICHLIFYGCSSLSYTILVSFLNESDVQKAAPYTGLFSFLNTMSHFFIYLIFSSQFREAFFALMNKKNVVTPLQIP